MTGWKNDDPPTMKKLPVAIDVPEFLSAVGTATSANELDRAIGDLVLIAFYYLLRVGEYTIKDNRNETKRTVQFRIQDVTFFKRNRNGQLRQLRRTSNDSTLMKADSATLKLENQKNGWKGVCVNQEANGELIHCPVRALARRYIHIRTHSLDSNTFLSAFFVDN